jgi:hypothetical protein
VLLTCLFLHTQLRASPLSPPASQHLATIVLLFLFLSFSLYIAQLLVHGRRIHINTAYRAEPH